MVLTANKSILTREQEVRMSLRDVYLHIVTLIAEFAPLPLGIRHLLLHRLYWKSSSVLLGFDFSSMCAKSNWMVIVPQSARKSSNEHKSCCLCTWGCCFVSCGLQISRYLEGAAFSCSWSPVTPSLLAFVEMQCFCPCCNYVERDLVVLLAS